MYDLFANDYDRFVNWKSRLALEMPFIEKLLAAHPSTASVPKKVLDSACGTGMHALAIAKLGFEVVGADFSGEMIAKARSNSVEIGLKARFEVIGFGSLAKNLGAGQFDAVLCLGNSLPHLHTQNEVDETLKDFASCLRPGGLLLIQNRNFDAVMAKKERWMEPQTHQEEKSEWVFQRFYNFEPDGLIQFNIVTLKRSGNSSWESSVSSTHLRPQLQKELVNALTTAGFGEIHSFGGLTGDLFVPLTSGNLVLAATKS
ncbi:MAG: hypothetical protein C0401_10795 [Anaerolinea sp.]|nr:hypothetical protein [Anaerolinea sp.]